MTAKEDEDNLAKEIARLLVPSIEKYGHGFALSVCISNIIAILAHNFGISEKEGHHFEIKLRNYVKSLADSMFLVQLKETQGKS